MNLVSLIQDQLTDSVTGQLTSLLGGDQKQTQSAIAAAIPGLLSAFSGVASGGGKGADQMVKALGGIDTGMLGDLAGMFTKSPEKVQSLGGGLLGTLLTGAVVSKLAGSIAKFTGMNQGTITKLLGYLSPLVLGMIAKHFKSQNQPVTTQSVNDMFKDQSGHIKKAFPAGFDLDDLLKGNTQADTRRAPEPQPAAPSLLKTLLPLAVMALLAFLAYRFFFSGNTAPPADNNAGTNQVQDGSEGAQMPTQLAETYREARDAVSNITDVASAEAALPRLNQLNEKLNGLALIWDKLPAQAREAVSAVTRNNFEEFASVVRPIMDIPGVTEKLRTVLTEILSKLQAFGGAA